jgi:hypothetical protein
MIALLCNNSKGSSEKKTGIIQNFLNDSREVEGMGFEPTKQLLVYTLSRRAPSTTRTPLSVGWFFNWAAKIALLS